MSELNVFMSIPQTHLPPHIKEQWIFLFEIAWVHPSIIKKEGWKLFHNVERSFFLSIFHPNHPLLLNSFIRTSEESIWRTAAPTLTHSDISKKKKKKNSFPLSHTEATQKFTSVGVWRERAPTTTTTAKKGKFRWKMAEVVILTGLRGKSWKGPPWTGVVATKGHRTGPEVVAAPEVTAVGGPRTVCVGWALGKLWVWKTGVRAWFSTNEKLDFFFHEGFWTFGIFWKGILVKLLMWNKFFKRLS